MARQVIRLVDPPRVVGDGEVVDGEEFFLQPPQYGRVLFTEAVALEVVGSGVVIRNCLVTYW